MDKKLLQLEAKLFKGFADQSRLCILKTIQDEEKTVSQIVRETKLSQPNVSTHLNCLLGCGLVKKEKRGRQIFYRTSTKEINKLLKAAQKILSNHSKEIYQCTRYLKL